MDVRVPKTLTLFAGQALSREAGRRERPYVILRRSRGLMRKRL